MSMSNFFGIQDDLEAKKMLLQREIVDKNYNKLQFVDYCSTRKPGGDDLQNWNISELEAVIKDFVRIHEEEERAKAFLPSSSSPQPPNVSNNKMSLDLLSQYNLNMISFTKEIKCKKIEPGILSNKDITVEIRNPKSNTTSLLSSNYISYEVFTSVTNWVVTRRFSDFLWLRETLRKFYPRQYVPPMASKKIGGRRFEEDFVLKRMGLLNKFINITVKNEIFKVSDPLISFLSIEDRNQFEFKMKELSNYQPSLFIEDMRTIDGKVKLLEDRGTENLNKNINMYFQMQSQLFQNLSYNMKNFYLNISAACTNLEEAQKDFETLSLLNSKVMLNEEVVRNYKELGIFFKNWKRILFNQNEIIHSHIRTFYKYVKMEGNAFKELTTSWEELKNKYDSENKKLMNKKEKLWTTMDITKWEIMEDFLKIDRLLLFRDKGYAFAKMCTNETKQVQCLLDQLNYANWVNNEQLKELVKRQGNEILLNTKAFTQDIYPSLTDMLDVWGNLDSFIQTM